MAYHLYLCERINYIHGHLFGGICLIGQVEFYSDYSAKPVVNSPSLLTTGMQVHNDSDDV